MSSRSSTSISKTDDDVGGYYDVCGNWEYLFYESTGDVPAEVSVIIPLYNYATTIVECLETVAAQTFKVVGRCGC